MIDRVDDKRFAELTQQVKQLSKQVRLNQAIALIAMTMLLCLLATGQKANAPGKLVTRELSMVDEEGREWAVFGLDGHGRRGLHLFAGAIGDGKTPPDRSRPVLSLIGNYIGVIDPTENSLLSMRPSRVELTSGDARAEMSVYHEPRQQYIDTPTPRRSVVAGLFLTAGDGHTVQVLGTNTPDPALGIVSPNSPAIVIEKQVPSPSGSLVRVWSAPRNTEATKDAP